MQQVHGAAVSSHELEEGRIVRLVLDAGKGNVITRAVIEELREHVDGLSRSESTCALILDHAGEHFSFGASVAEHAQEEVGTMLPAFHALARELLALDLPILASVRGLCLGGGLELALLADRVWASPSARFGQPEVSLAVFAPIGSALLPRRIAATDASELLVSGRTIGAEEAAELRLASAITGDPGRAAQDWAREHLANKSAAALRHATAAARRPWLRGFLADLEDLEARYLEELMRTRDAAEGIAAFLERREPVWEDR